MEPDDIVINIDSGSTISIGHLPGDVWFNTTNSSLYVNDGSEWVINPCSEIVLTQTAFKDYVPSPREIEEMCEEYPGLKKAYENFKTFYKLVEQDWIGKKKDAENK
jgi:hypothetical protein